MPKENAFLQLPTRLQSRSRSWHRTRSRSRDRRERRSAEPVEIEHLVRAFLEYAMHLFQNGMPRTRDSSDGNQTQDSPGTSDITHVLLTQIMKYAIRQYLKSRESRASKKRIQKMAIDSVQERGRSKHRDQERPSSHSVPPPYREATPPPSERKPSHTPYRPPPSRIRYYTAQPHHPRPAPEKRPSPRHDVTEAQRVSALLAALDDLQWSLARAAAEARQVRELVQKPPMGR